LTGDGPKINSPLTAPARDVTATGDNGLACSALPAGSLTGAWALIQRGTCYYSDKINFAQAAGAIGAIIYQSDGIDDFTARMYVQNTGIPFWATPQARLSPWTRLTHRRITRR
jgi:hypothetical protein